MKILPRASGLIELECSCGVGHPSRKLTEFVGRVFTDVDDVHGCCPKSCCTKKHFANCERSLAGELASRKRRIR